MDKETLLTLDEVARKLKLSRGTLYRWIKEKKIKAIVLPSGRLRIPEEELEKILQTQHW